ncbi:MAG: hypothetical protein AAB697_00815 [Patescibacteria group bacterium]
MNKMIVTNLRIPETDYLRVKERALDLEMSVNEYLNYLVKEVAPKNVMFMRVRKKKSMYQALMNLAKASYKRKPMGASEEDKIIYDTK